MKKEFSPGFSATVSGLIFAGALSAISLGSLGCVSPPPNPGQPTLTVLTTGTGTGSVIATVGSLATTIDCRSGSVDGCSEDFTVNSQITLLAQAGTHSIFSGWSGACTGNAPTCTVTINDAQNVIAQFDLISESLTVTLTGNGKGTVVSQPDGIECPDTSGSNVCSENVTFGNSVVLTAAPQTGSKFAGWSGACSGTTLTCKITGGESPVGATAQFSLLEPVAPLVTTITAGGTAQGQVQSLGVNYYIANFGIFPSQSGAINSSGENYWGQIMMFAPGAAPSGWLPCDGSLLDISQNTALFSLIGTIYGGNGTSNFALPDLRARSAIGVGTLANPANPNPSSASSSSAPLISSVTWGGVAQGQAQALGVNYYIAMQGVYPSSGGNAGAATYLGQVMIFAGGFAPGGWRLCDGAELPISQNQALFSLLTTTYGGNGTTTFAVPDLRARTPMGVGALNNPSLPVQTPGAPNAPLISSVTEGASSQGQIGVLGLNTYVSAFGVYPQPTGGFNTSGTPYIGQMMYFAGNFAPGGWILANGAPLQISQNQALFSLLGTLFGGDGQTNFEVPDFRGRVAMDVGQR